MMFWTIRRFVLDIPSKARSLLFRLRHGFSREDTWALDTATAKFLAPRLLYLAEHHCGYPHQFDGEDGDELWTAILAKMADGFERIAEDRTDIFDDDYDGECLDLFRAFFFSLWD
jgi:hypothetical protein